MIKIYYIPLVILFSVGPVLADGTKSGEMDESSANYRKAKDQFLPGEEVVTPSGKKMRVFSTSGPVPVNQAPQPGTLPQTREGQVKIDDLNVIVPGATIPRSRLAESEGTSRSR